MAEIKKRITQLDPALGPLDGTEVSAVVQGGVTKKIAESNKYGAGWWDKLKAAFVDFVAPDADHADNADTLGAGLEEPSDFHDAAQLTGVLDLDRIPVELTGKNASTADYADTAGSADTISGFDPVNGTAGTYGAVELPHGDTWVIPAGTYVFAPLDPDGNNRGCALQIQITAGVWDPPDANALLPLSGLVISDGVNYRLRNSRSSGTAYSGYRKLA